MLMGTLAPATTSDKNLMSFLPVTPQLLRLDCVIFWGESAISLNIPHYFCAVNQAAA